MTRNDAELKNDEELKKRGREGKSNLKIIKKHKAVSKEQKKKVTFFFTTDKS